MNAHRAFIGRRREGENDNHHGHQASLYSATPTHYVVAIEGTNVPRVEFYGSGVVLACQGVTLLPPNGVVDLSRREKGPTISDKH